MPTVTQSRRPLPLGRRTGVQLGAVLAIWVAAGLVVGLLGHRYHFDDLRIYHDALRWWFGGEDLYRYADAGGLGFSYPPFTALLMAPIAWLPTPVAGWLVLAAGVTALTLILTALLAPLAGWYGWSRGWVVAAAVPLALATDPVRETLGAGQLNMLVLGLIMADLVALRRRSRAAARQGAGWRNSPGFRHLRRNGWAAWSSFWRAGGWAGVGIGLATAVKVTPALFIVHLLVTRQWRAARTAGVTAAFATAVAALVSRDETIRYFGGILWQTDRVGAADSPGNQALSGLLARLYGSPEAPALLWLTFSLLLLAVGLTRASAAHADGDELTAFVLVGLAAALASPVSWTHQLLFLLPAVLVLLDGAARRRQARLLRPATSHVAGVWHAAAALGIYALLVLAPMWHSGSIFAANAFVLLMIVLVSALPWRSGAEPAFMPQPWTAVGPPGRGPIRQRRPVRPRGPVKGS